MSRCPLCFSGHCSVRDGEDGVFVRCQTYGAGFGYSSDMTEERLGSDRQQQLLNLMAERLLREKTARDGAGWFFCYDPEESGRGADPARVNLANLLPNYPRAIGELVDRALMNLSLRFPRYGIPFSVAAGELRLCFASDPEHPEDALGVVRMLLDFGYVEKAGSKGLFNITADGWKRVEQMKRHSSESRQGFVAMSFCPESAPIREAIRRAMNAMGYAAVIIDEKEHNNQIVPEILHEIRRSRFVVMDVTYPNLGAYFESGYAQGQGKELIVCCRKSAFDSKDTQPHFDIAQKSLVIWEDERDLERRLARRIEATVQ